jgi:hypothetical protein
MSTIFSLAYSNRVDRDVSFAPVATVKTQLPAILCGTSAQALPITESSAFLALDK